MSNNLIATYVIDVSDNSLYTVQQLLVAARNGSALVTALNTQLGSTAWQTGTPSGAAMVSAINTELGSSTWQAGAGAGDVVGPASSVDSQLVLFNSTTGKLLKAASATGIAKITSGVLSVVSAPSGTIVGTSDAQLLANKRMSPRILVTTTASSITLNVGTYDQVAVTALAEACSIEEPIGSPLDGDKILYCIKDNATPRTLTWNSIFRDLFAVLPTSTVASKTTYALCRYNEASAKWDVLDSRTEV